MLAAKRITEAHHNVNELARSQALAGMKADELVQSFDFERRKRSLFQYSTSKTAKHSKAQTSLFRAREFVFELKKLLCKPTNPDKATIYL